MSDKIPGTVSNTPSEPRAQDAPDIFATGKLGPFKHVALCGGEPAPPTRPLVDRLRHPGLGSDQRRDAVEAANVIERQREALETIANHVVGSMKSDAAALIGAIQTARTALSGSHDHAE